MNTHTGSFKSSQPFVLPGVLEMMEDQKSSVLLCCYVSGITRKEFRKPNLVFGKSAKKIILEFNKIYYKTTKFKLSITKSNGKYQ